MMWNDVTVVSFNNFIYNALFIILIATHLIILNESSTYPVINMFQKILHKVSY